MVHRYVSFSLNMRKESTRAINQMEGSDAVWNFQVKLRRLK